MHTLPLLTTDDSGRSVFAKAAWPNEPRGGMALSPRIASNSLRMRISEPGYFADWHIAGPADEPVLIIVQQGALRIGLQDKTHRDFTAGQAFIANDSLPQGMAFDTSLHGHTAQVVSDHPMHAVHIKLAESVAPM